MVFNYLWEQMRKLFLLPFLFLIAFSCKAQFIKTLGVKIGATQSLFTHTYRTSSFDPAFTVESGTKTGFTSMVAVDFVQKKYWDLNSSIGYVQKCSYRAYPDYNKPTYRIDYLSLVSSIRGKIPISKVINFYGQVGLRYDYQIYQHGQFVILSGKKPDLNSTYGMNTGAGISYRYEKVILSGEASRNFNFNKVFSKENLGWGNDTYYHLNDTTWLFYFSVAYVFTKDSAEGQ